MKTEKEIRKDIENQKNVKANSLLLYERTTISKFLKNAQQSEIWINALLWVLDEFEPQEEIIRVDTKDIG